MSANVNNVMQNILPHQKLRRFAQPIALALARAGVTANQITILGVLGNIGAAVLIARGDFLAGGLVLLAASALDAVDGAIARATGRATPFGAVFDAVMDRISEAAVILGLLVYFTDRGEQQESILCFVAVVGSLMVSYVRARAESHGFSVTEGLFTRTERVILLGIGLIIDQATIALWILAVLTPLTAAQRLYLVWRKAQQTEGNQR
jgi:CDP-diacylglycerol--glycerol-3-phosphate 3-phosphatidyltransferase